MIDFEHLVQVNDRSNPAISSLSREQLWRGLIARVERPELFLVGLEGCEILERASDTLRRRVRFGSVQVTDRVTLAPMTSVVHDIEPTDGIAASRLTIRIEEPAAGDLFLRFKYEASTRGTAAEIDRFYAAHVEQAYLQADVDAVRVIRELAAQGTLDDHAGKPT